MERKGESKLVRAVIDLLLLILAWLNAVANNIIKNNFGLNPRLNPLDAENINDFTDPTLDEFVGNVGAYVDDNPALKTFFKDKPDYIKEVAKKAADLSKDPTTSLGCKEILPKTIKVTLHQQAIFCDDSGSMKRDGRWDSQKQLVDRIARITTRILPEGEGVSLHFMNQDLDNSTNLTLEMLTGVLESVTPPQGNTPIGTSLNAKILRPLVYDKVDLKQLARPLLVTIITDGMPDGEKKSQLEDTIVQCGDILEKSGYPRECVKFMIGQIGTAKNAKKFLDSLRSNAQIADVTYITSDQLDAKYSEYQTNERELDQWLVETLFMPIMLSNGKS